jgi:hypothetical protein
MYALMPYVSMYVSMYAFRYDSTSYIDAAQTGTEIPC